MQAGLLTKKNDSYRLCIHYRELNRKTMRDRYPLSNIENHIDNLHKVTRCSHHWIYGTGSIDLRNRKYTSFIALAAQYEFLKSSLSLTNSMCQKFINGIFRDFITQCVVLVYVDDVIIIAKDEEQGLKRLKDVLKRADDLNELGLM